jgi:uncharacterized protein YndB with AHSA1/START domain
MTPSPDAFAAWTAWFAELGEHLVDRGNPTFVQASVGECGAGTVLGGYTLLRADDLAAVVELARRHPLVARGGGVEIGELTLLNAGGDAAGDYTRTLHVDAPTGAVHAALTTLEGLAGWWTHVTGSATAGGELQLWFDPPEPCVVHVDDATASSVRWTVLACDFLPDWVGTRPTFTIVPVDERSCELRFRHHGLHARLECFDQCTNGWDHFLASLRRYAETGRGMPRGSDEDAARRAARAGA